MLQHILYELYIRYKRSLKAIVYIKNPSGAK